MHVTDSAPESLVSGSPALWKSLQRHPAGVYNGPSLRPSQGLKQVPGTALTVPTSGLAAGDRQEVGA